MPDGNDLESIAANAEVNPVANAVDEESSNAGRARLRHLNAHGWLLGEQREGSFEIDADRPWCRRAVDRPPSCDAIDLPRRSPCDEELESHD
jgi:hypothetical protein